MLGVLLLASNFTPRCKCYALNLLSELPTPSWCYLLNLFFGLPIRHALDVPLSRKIGIIFWFKNKFFLRHSAWKKQLKWPGIFKPSNEITTALWHRGIFSRIAQPLARFPTGRACLRIAHVLNIYHTWSKWMVKHVLRFPSNLRFKTATARSSCWSILAWAGNGIPVYLKREAHAIHVLSDLQIEHANSSP